MTSVRSEAGETHSFFRTLKEETRRAWSELRQLGLAKSFKRTFEELQAFYLTEEQRHTLEGMRTLQRWMHLLWWLFRALFLKLTPARRILLVIALVLTVVAGVSISVGNDHASVRAPITGSALLLVLIMLELKDKLLARHELEAGRAVQMALMPEENPSIQGWDIWLYTRPANDVGGDLVDHLSIGNGHHRISLADVAGKALPAALLMAKVQSTLRALCTEFDSLTEFGQHVNRILCRDGLPDRFVTLVHLDLAQDSGRLRYLNAGHMPPILVQQGRAIALQPGNIAMGLIATSTFSESTVEIDPGDALVVYSDGVTEAMNDAGDFFGDERLIELLPALSASPSSTIGQRILDEVNRFVGDARWHDDLSLVILKRRV